MGYTHYWNFKPATLKVWEAKIADCDKIIAANKETYELNLDGSNDERIWLNGPDDGRDLGHETFDVPRTLAGTKAHVEAAKKQKWKDEDTYGFDFCKTARKPYDDVVVACLCVLAETGLDVSSDGDHDEWEDGRKLAEQVLSRPVANPIERDA